MQLEKREPVWMKKGHSSAGGGGTKKAFLSGVMAGKVARLALGLAKMQMAHGQDECRELKTMHGNY